IRYTAPGSGPEQRTLCIPYTTRCVVLRQRTDQRFRWSEPYWWARQGLNLRPLPCQQNGGNRCARSRSRRSPPTVDPEGKRSIDVKGNALFHSSNSACTGRSLHLQRSSTVV